MVNIILILDITYCMFISNKVSKNGILKMILLPTLLCGHEIWFLLFHVGMKGGFTHITMVY